MVAKSAIMIFLEVFWKHILQNEAEVDGIRMPLDVPMNAVPDWHLSQVMGEQVDPLHTMIGQQAFRHLPVAPGTLTRLLSYLPSIEGRQGSDHRGITGIELGKSGAQESARKPCRGAGAPVEKSAIITFGECI
jgi:hypothetical protein